jgi:uncharacterized protein YndB with AHSA1/START domain
MGELRMERRYTVAPETVFAFVTEPAHLLQWWGPEGTDVAEYDLDLMRPGPWFLVLIDPQGGKHRMSGEVLAVDPPRSVEFTMIVPGTDPAIDSTVRFEVEPDGKGGARFVLIQSGITEEMIAMGSRGWGSTLARLDRLIDASS